MLLKVLSANAVSRMNAEKIIWQIKNKRTK